LTTEVEAGCEISPPVKNCLPETGGNFYFQTESVWARPIFTRNVAYPKDAGPPGGFIRFNDYDDYDYSTRFELGYMAPSSSIGFRARYWGYEGDSTVGAGDDTNFITNDETAFWIGPSNAIDDADNVSYVAHSLDVDVFDFEATKDCFSIGLRYADFLQTFRAFTEAGDRISHMGYEGLGPTASVAFDFPLVKNKGLSFYSSLRGSLLFGEFSISPHGEGGNEAVLLIEDTKAVTNFEATGGIEWRPCNFENVYIRAGMEAQFWGNVGNQMNYVDRGNGFSQSDAQGEYPGVDDNISFIGYNITTGFKF